MRITQCDLCRRKIKKEPITAGIGFWRSAELCEKCGAPILRFLKKNQLIRNPKIKPQNSCRILGDPSLIKLGLKFGKLGSFRIQSKEKKKNKL